MAELEVKIDLKISRVHKELIRRFVFDGGYKNQSEWIREAVQEKLDREKRERAATR